MGKCINVKINNPITFNPHIPFEKIIPFLDY